jgi:hypothetical protein
VRARAEASGAAGAVEEWCEEYFGAGAFGGPTVPRDPSQEPPEVIGRLAWRTADRESCAAVARAADPGLLGLSGPPQVSGDGRRRGGGPTQLLAVDAIALPRELVDGQVRVSVETA